MMAGWQIVAFPVILPWREEFWTLPLYFPDLKVGVVPGWPRQLPYQGMPLPPEAEVVKQELQHFKPGDLRQWQAFENYQQALTEEGDLLKAIRNYGTEIPPETVAPDSWSLVWQLEKLQADQEAQMLLVDRGQEWLGEILTPEPWEERQSFGVVPGVGETTDPELARLRYLLWQRVLAAGVEEPWAPLLLGRSSRALFLTLKGWPEWTDLKVIEVPLPGCRSKEEWQEVKKALGRWQEEFGELLAGLLAAAKNLPDLEGAAHKLEEFVNETLMPRWPFPEVWKWDLEIWSPGSPESEAEERPVLCWAGAGTGILPG
jgi:hypothetical protein